MDGLVSKRPKLLSSLTIFEASLIVVTDDDDDVEDGSIGVGGGQL